MTQRMLRVLGVLSALVLLLLMPVMYAPVFDDVRAQNVDCYTQQGGSKVVASSGCEYEFQSGSTLDIQSGSTVNLLGTNSFGNTTITETLTVSGATDLVGNVSSSTGAFTITDNLLIDGAADAVQLTAQGHSTQTNDILVVETSDGSNVFDVDNNGNTEISGTLTLKSVSFSGPIAFGTASNVVSGTEIAHGLGTTPTVTVLTPEHLTPVFTNVIYILSTNSTSITVGLGQTGVTGGITTVNTVHWMAGK